MGYDIRMIRAWVRRARTTAKATGKTLTAVLDEINNAVLGSGAQDGGVVISTSEGGGTVSLSFPPGMRPLELAALNEEAIAWCHQFSDPNTPPIDSPRRIMRLRATFFKSKP